MASDNSGRKRKNGRKISRKQKAEDLRWELSIANNMRSTIDIAVSTLEGVVEGFKQLDGRYVLNYTAALKHIEAAYKEINIVSEKLKEDINLAE